MIWIVNAKRFKENFSILTAIPNPNSQLLINYNFVVDSNGLTSEILFQLKDELKIHGPVVKKFSLKDEELKEVFDEYNEAEKIYYLLTGSIKSCHGLIQMHPSFWISVVRTYTG